MISTIPFDVSNILPKKRLQKKPVVKRNLFPKDPFNNDFNLVFHDTETTGISPSDRIVSSCFLNHSSLNKFKIIEEYCSNDKNIPISIESSLVNGITNSMIENKPVFSKTQNYKYLNNFNNENYIYVAYNSYFDLNMLSKEGLVWKEENIIDLYRVAKFLFKDKFISEYSNTNDKDKISVFKLQYFRYLLNFDEQKDFKSMLNVIGIDKITPHEASSDVIILYYFYHYIIKNFNLSIEEMIRMSKTPILENEVNFGSKFEKGADLNRSIISDPLYFQWYVDNTDPMLDREFSIKYYLSKAIIDNMVPKLKNSFNRVEDVFIDGKINKQFMKYINYSYLFSFSEEERRQAFKFINTDKDFDEYFEALKSSYLVSTTKILEKLINDDVKSNLIDNILFLHRYLKVL